MLALHRFSKAASEDSGVHDDFKAQYNAEPSSTVEQQIQKDIAENKVFLYMKVSTTADTAVHLLTLERLIA